ncbi:hypothetical protein KI387_040665, partial [Taxus chinensis]
VRIGLTWKEVGLGGMCHYRCIHRDMGLLLALFERWDHVTGTFWLPTGEMTITLEDIHRILCLPVQGEQVYVIDE